MPELGCEAMDSGIEGGICREKTTAGSVECIDGVTRRFCRWHLEMVVKARETIIGPSNAPPPLDVSIDCAKLAILRVEDADRRFREEEMSATATVFDRMRARAQRVRAEGEFGWQWRNVKRIFEEKGI